MKYLETFENHKYDITQKLSDIKLLQDDELFGWYNPDSNQVFTKGKMSYPKKPSDSGNWYLFHTHPIGESGKPSEIDIMSAIEKGNEDPLYILSSEGLYKFQLPNNKAAKEKLHKLYKRYGVKDFDDFYEKHGNDEIPDELDRKDFHKYIGVIITLLK